MLITAMASPRNVKSHLPILIFVIGFLLYLLLLYPGFMSTDSVSQLLEARRGHFSDWHPPFMVLIWQQIDKLVSGPSGMLFIQITLLWCGIYLIFYSFFRNNRPIFAAISLFAIMFFPLVIAIAGAIWKDVWMWAMLLLSIGAIGFSKTNLNQRYLAWFFLVVSALFITLALLFRHNAVFAVFPILFLAVSTKLKLDTLKNVIFCALISSVLTIALFLLSGKINSHLADKKTYPWMASAVFDISGIIVRTEDNEIQFETFKKLSETLDAKGDLSLLIANYSNDYWYPIFNATPPVFVFQLDNFKVFGDFGRLPQKNRNELFNLWINSIIEHPLLWLEHRTDVTSHIVGLTNNKNWLPAMFNTNGFPKRFAAIYGKNPEPTEVQKALSWRINILYDHFVFQPIFYLLILVLIVVTTIAIPKCRNVICTSIATSGIFYEVGLFLFAPSPDFRYSHYMIFCCLLSILFLVSTFLSRDRNFN